MSRMPFKVSRDHLVSESAIVICSIFVSECCVSLWNKKERCGGTREEERRPREASGNGGATLGSTYLRRNLQLRRCASYRTLRRGIENSGFWSRSRLRREGFPPRFSLYILRQPSSPTGVPSASASVMKTFAHRHFTDFLMT
ncbi:uncharacterized protein [Temnothorax nylanderi]|uniref:uncharacterized protein isoform X1 n=1 Tax=Temnothorax nylanderi TaxID=102681 RepID=UPI003A86DAE2